MTLSECLNAAADLIEQNDWVQGAWSAPAYAGKPAAYCMVGAIRKVCPDVYAGTATNNKTLDALGCMTIDDAIDWNDRPGRTKEQVVAELRFAARRAAALEGDT